jgi:hypothetical protein
VAGSVDGRRWREAYLRKTYAETTYRPYEDLVREAVDTGLPAAAFADRLVARYGELEPWPEVGEVLGRLAEDVPPLSVVTNCSDALGQVAAARITIAFHGRPDGALDRIHSFQQASRCNRDKLEAEAAIGVFMHSFQTQGLSSKLIHRARSA